MNMFFGLSRLTNKFETFLAKRHTCHHVDSKRDLYGIDVHGTRCHRIILRRETAQGRNLIL